MKSVVRQKGFGVTFYSREGMFDTSLPMGVKGWWGVVCASWEPIQCLKNIPEKSGTENFSKEI